jgi:molecular chaperone GrpE
MSHNTQKPGMGDDGEASEEAYELDLDAGLLDPETAIRDAIAAVEARRGDSDESDPPGDERDVGGDETDDLVRRLQEEVEDLRDRSIRTLADFENYRRRVERERDDHRRYAAAEALGEFIEVMDNVERALASAASGDDLRRGVGMIHRQMEDLLLRLGAVPVPAVGARFDPAWHEAVARQEDPGVEAPTVVEEYQRGYRLHERLLRPARVRVAVPSEASGSETRAAGGAAG